MRGPSKTKNRVTGRFRLTPRHRKALDLVAGGMSQLKASKEVGFHPTWINAVLSTSEVARKYLEDSKERIVAKNRLLMEGAVNEHLRAMYAEEMGLSEKQRAKLAVSREMAVQAGMQAHVARAAGIIDSEQAPVAAPNVSVRFNVLAMLKDPTVAASLMKAAHDAAEKGLLVETDSGERDDDR
jgi:hypothetical protein